MQEVLAMSTIITRPGPAPRSLLCTVHSTRCCSAKSAYTRNAVRAFDPAGQARAHWSSVLVDWWIGGRADARTKVVSMTVFVEVYIGPV
jgi:hypothetical protein